jgi:hypothetical protein
MLNDANNNFTLHFKQHGDINNQKHYKQICIERVSCYNATNIVHITLPGR